MDVQHCQSHPMALAESAKSFPHGHPSSLHQTIRPRKRILIIIIIITNHHHHLIVVQVGEGFGRVAELPGVKKLTRYLPVVDFITALPSSSSISRHLLSKVNIITASSPLPSCLSTLTVSRLTLAMLKKDDDRHHCDDYRRHLNPSLAAIPGDGVSDGSRGDCCNVRRLPGWHWHRDLGD